MIRYKFNAIVFAALAVAASAKAQTTGIRPDQITPATPDITWGPGGTGYQIGTTVPWRLDSTATPTFTSADNAKVIELTFNGTMNATLPAATGVLGDGAGFTIQVAQGTLTLNPQSGAKINGQTSIKVGAYQSVALVSRAGNWYASLSVPQPSTQGGGTVLADSMTWQTPATGGGGAPTGSCSQSTAFFTRVWALPATLDGTVGGTAGPTNHVAAYDNLICGLVADSVWAVLDALWVPATNASTGSATAVANLNLVSSSFTLVPTTGANAPTFTANTGYTGGAYNNTTVYIDTGYTPSTGTNYLVGSAHMMAWALNDYQSAGYTATMGAYDASNGSVIIPWSTAGTAVTDLNVSTAAFGGYNSTHSLGSATNVRSATAANSLQAYRNGAAQTLNTTSPAATARPTTHVYLLANNNNSVVGSAGPYIVGAASIGGLLNATTAPAVSSSGTTTTGTGLVPRLCTYLTAVHGSC